MIRFLLTTFIAFFTVTFSLSAAPVSRDKAISYLARWEGVRLAPYADGTQIAVGIGHMLRGPHKSLYTHDDIAAFFNADLANARRICRNGIFRFDDLNDDAQLVAIGLAFTVGPTGFNHFYRFRNALSRRHLGTAAQELRRSKWWVQVGPYRAMDSWRRLVESD